MKSQQLRKLAPELDSLRLGSGWKIDELSKPQIIVESSYGHSHPGSAHLDKLVDEAGIGIKEKGGRAANYFVTDRKSTRLNSSHSDLVCRLLLEKSPSLG